MSETQVVSIHELEKYVDRNVTIQGWVHGIRGSNARQFVSLRTGGRILQVLAEKEILGEETFQTVKHLKQETSVTVSGKLVRNEKSPIGFELVSESIRVVGESENYP
ncbi:OB-fold nucleic acid binding domain-containing protein, partial [Leptospira ellisii]